MKPLTSYLFQQTLKPTLLLLLAISLFSSGCKSNKVLSETEPGVQEDQAPTSFTGRFRSIRGVMNPLSCYCYNGGYLTTREGEEIPICLADDAMEVMCDGDVTLSGKWTTKSIDPENNNPCPSGTKRFLLVKEVNCP